MTAPDPGPDPTLRGTLPPDPPAVVIVCPGGLENGHRHMPDWALPNQRMRLVAHAIDQGTRGALAVTRLHYRYVGWNGEAEDPVRDLDWALRVVRMRLPGVPIILVGHSMGGRVVLARADAPGVIGVVALAPWIEKEDVARGRPGVEAYLVHGEWDPITDPDESRRMTADLVAAGVDAHFIPIRYDFHNMLFRAPHWHRVIAESVRNILAHNGIRVPSGPQRKSSAR